MNVQFNQVALKSILTPLFNSKVSLLECHIISLGKHCGRPYVEHTKPRLPRRSKLILVISYRANAISNIDQLHISKPKTTEQN